MEPLKTESADNLTDEEKATISALLRYPALEKIFDDAARKSELAGMKQKMRSTVAELERVVRRGSQTEAEKAQKIIEAYQITLNFLDELELRRGNRSA